MRALGYIIKYTRRDFDVKKISLGLFVFLVAIMIFSNSEYAYAKTRKSVPETGSSNGNRTIELPNLSIADNLPLYARTSSSDYMLWSMTNSFGGSANVYQGYGVVSCYRSSANSGYALDMVSTISASGGANSVLI